MCALIHDGVYNSLIGKITEFIKNQSQGLLLKFNFLKTVVGFKYFLVWTPHPPLQFSFALSLKASVHCLPSEFSMIFLCGVGMDIFWPRIDQF